MIKISHPWFRNRNKVVGNTVFSFNSEGIAKVKEIGTVWDDVNQLLKEHKFELVTEDVAEFAPPPVVEKKVVKEELKPVITEEAAAPIIEEVEEPVPITGKSMREMNPKAKKTGKKG